MNQTDSQSLTEIYQEFEAGDSVGALEHLHELSRELDDPSYKGRRADGFSPSASSDGSAKAA